jgi:hypothetical protein
MKPITINTSLKASLGGRYYLRSKQGIIRNYISVPFVFSPRGISISHDHLKILLKIERKYKKGKKIHFSLV